MTSRCRLYMMETEIKSASPDELKNEAFWNRLDEKLAETLEEVDEMFIQLLSDDAQTEEELEEFRRVEEWKDE